MIYADILFFALMAAFIFFRLRGAFGKDDGTRERMADKIRSMQQAAAEAEREVKNAARDAEVVDITPLHADEATSDKLVEQVNKLRKIDPNFNLPEFMGGANAAFEMILNAYSDHDRDTLKSLLAKDVYELFDEALTAGEKADQNEHITLVAIKSSVPEKIALRASKAKITIRFDTEQIRVLKNAKGDVVEGSAANIDLLDDEWTFERDLRSPNPNWTVIDT